MKTATRKPSGQSRNLDSYIRLAAQFIPRPITNDKEYDAAVKVMEGLAVRGEKDLNEDEMHYLDAIIAAYDNKHYTFEDNRTPLQRLQYILSESETTPTALQKILGCSQSLVSMILTGSRELSKDNIRSLASYFKVEPGLFL